ncbi:TRAP-type C4-dicarboxylate transport system substrate-binding protein [Mesorhizobium sp. J18]|uniref:TRAP transporter substrate-binding protein n=1 Tax=Mesorhizobium sp. J18 TaxID=935263 RepID=UPI00119A88FF|nr:TRAP transporter substrate-binding protein [Mesorhizobium sp. J18]TWG92810.1 TRAP-type C4-dicarboxylate transport system substrate-binding protein [Mesorhizobium sp. J18]
MKRLLNVLCPLVLAASTALAAAIAASSPAAADVVLKYSPWLPPQHAVHVGLINPWIEEVEKATEGRVKIEFLPKAVGNAAGQFDVVRDGLADMGVILPGYTPGRFPLLEIGELPLLSSDAAVIAPAFYRLYVKHLEQLNPLKGTHVITIFSTTPNQVVSGRSIIDKTADFVGLKLRAPTVTSIPIINALDAVPVQKPVSEMYELASSGIVDGTFFAATAVVDWKLGKLLPYMTRIPGGIGQPVMAILVNEQKWESISEADRKAIMDLSGEKLAAKAGENYAASEKVAYGKLEAEGVKIEDAQAGLVGELKEKLASVDQKWFESAKKAGLENPEAVLNEFRAELQKSAD